MADKCQVSLNSPFGLLQAKLPDAWEPKLVVTYAGPVLDNFQTNVVINNDSGYHGTDLDEFVQRQTASLQTGLANAKFNLVYSKRTTVAGRPAQEVKFSWCLRDPQVIEQLQFYVLNGNGQNKIFTFSATSNSYPILEPTFRQILDSVSLD